MTKDLTRITVPAKSAKAFLIKTGQTARIIDVEGRQPGDFVAFNPDDLSEKFSQARTRMAYDRLSVSKGCQLWTNTLPPRVMFTITKDSYGQHDLIFVPCSRYGLKKRWGISADGCWENLEKALRPWKIGLLDISTPLNLFFNVGVNPDKSFRIGKQTSKPGDYIDLRAEMDSLVAVAACPAPLADKPNSPFQIEISN